MGGSPLLINCGRAWAFALGFTLAAATPAVASEVWGTTRELVRASYGVTYWNQSYAENSGSTSSYQTVTTASQEMRAGFMGTKARLYKDAAVDYLCEQTSFWYPDTPTKQHWAVGTYGGSGDNGGCGDGYFYSSGQSNIWLSKQWYTYNAYRTPNIYMID